MDGAESPRRLTFLSTDRSYHSDSSDSMQSPPPSERRILPPLDTQLRPQAGSPSLSERGLPSFSQLRLLADEARPMAEKALRGWGVDLVAMNNVTDGHALYVTAMSVLQRHDLVAACNVDPAALTAFLLRIESKYGTGTYHNSVHGADVMLHMHLLLDQHGLTKRLSKQQLFAAFIGALIHDFNHPGSTNAHEIKTGSFLALTYSDSSVLERHHLASSFAVMRTKGYDILSGLSPDDYKTVRSTVIELVLSTDLAGHFDFLIKLRALSATRGWTAHDVAATAVAAAPTALDLPSGAAATMDSVTRRIRRSKQSADNLDPVISVTMPATRRMRRSKESADLDPVISVTTPPSIRRMSHSNESVRSSCGSSGVSGRGLPGNVRPSEPSSTWHSPFLDEDVDVHLVLTTAIKFADLNHAAKPWSQHVAWSERIMEEFWEIGDKEKQLGISVSPLCDREVDTDLAGSQLGFFQFICNPFYELMADLVDPNMPPYAQLKSNFATWKEKHQSRLSD